MNTQAIVDLRLTLRVMEQELIGTRGRAKCWMLNHTFLTTVTNYQHMWHDQRINLSKKTLLALQFNVDIGQQENYILV